MKIYTVTFDTATLSPARIWVAPHSQFAIGVKVFVNGTEAEGAVTLKKDGAAIPADESKVGGFTVFQTTSGETGSAEYEVSVAGLSQKMKLVQVTTDSTVFDVGGSVSGGGDMSDYYTKEQTDGLLSAKADESDLTAYATTDSLTAFYEKSETSSAAEIGTALEGKQPAGNYLTAETEPAFAAVSADLVVDGDLTAYYTKSETSSATEIGTALAGKQPSGDYATTDSLTAYVTVEALTAYATSIYTKSESSSAAEIQTALAGKQPSGNYLTAETEPAFAAVSADLVVDGDLTAFYTKSETSSATEIGTAFAGKVTNLSSVSGIMKISQADYDALSAGGTADANTLYVIV